MAGESSRQNPGERRTSDGDSVQGAGPSMIDEDAQPLAARIAQRLRDAGIGCEIVALVPTQTAVLRRDRIVVSIALAVLTGLAWSYLLWLSADMSMGGMDMTAFRVIPSGIGLMPADMPWRAMEFAFVFAMWTVMMVGMMTPSAVPMILMYARVGRQTQAHGRPLAELFGSLLAISMSGPLSR